MPDAKPHALMPSLLDRLIDPDSGGTAWQQGYSVAQMIDAVRSDLEDLLNTRQSFHDVPAEFRETVRSSLTYGLPDLATMRAGTAAERARIGTLLEELISRFEPRLRGVRVTLVQTERDTDRRVSFHIDARLAVEPAPEVGFVTVLELTTGQASVAPRAS
ncbi:MAG TPA: type VI secretion system baseplate subunit TssE [Gemmataceae bacterium]|nr:type VI secretion system baseplate subunit TssE [Gemmataceae bacterium]